VQERSFVLTPLMEIAPHYLHPLLQCSITDLHRLLGEHTGVTLSPHTL
jgi:7,8-dihydro-6-hydroxymethylpterin-pyrophosphokinase